MNTEEARSHFADDPYGYRKYGAKGPTNTRQSTRHYFKCNVDGCEAKKVIEISNIDGNTKIEMVNVHSHDPPSAEGKPKKKHRMTQPEDLVDAIADAALPAIAAPIVKVEAAPEATKSKRASAKNVSNIVQLVKNGNSYLDSYDSPPTPVNRARAAPKIKSEVLPFAGTPPSSPDVYKPSASKASKACSPVSPHHPTAATPSLPAATDAAAAVPYSECQYPGHEGVHWGDTRLEVRKFKDDGELQLLFRGDVKEYSDSYSWRKYGKKNIKGFSDDCPRFYWRCTEKDCDIKRHTQPTANGETDIYYYGRHNHYPPSRRHGRAPKRSLDVPSSPCKSHDMTGRATSSAAANDRNPFSRTAPGSPAASLGSDDSGNLSDFDPHGTRDGSIPDSSRCPLFFLACIASAGPNV